MSQSKAPQFPIAGGDYVDEGNGLKKVGGSTAPKKPMSEIRAEQAAKRATDTAAIARTEPAKPKADKA